MLFNSKPLEGKLIERINRFLGIVDLKGNHVKSYIPNPGRMNELLYQGATVYLTENQGLLRKTNYDMVLVKTSNTLVSIDSRTPNIVVHEGIASKRMTEFKDFRVKRREPTFRDSRLDFLLENNGNKLLLEVKSCTLVEEGTALFPDAPTKRGLRHVNTLLKALTSRRAAILIVIQREDAHVFRPHWEMDPEFSEGLRIADRQGVDVHAYSCEVTMKGVSLAGPVRVELDRN